MLNQVPFRSEKSESKEALRAIFISDLHLSLRTQKTSQLFFDFLRDFVREGDDLYILGDLFVLWAGDDDKSFFNEKVKMALKNLHLKGARVFLLPGNRDFLLGETFAFDVGCTLLTDPCFVSIFGRKTLLTHGDKLARKNDIHKRFRYFFDKFGKKIFFKLPLFVRKSLAYTVHGISFCRNKFIIDETFLAQNREDAVLAMWENNIDQIIYGHIHRQSIEECLFGERMLRRIVLGEWSDFGSALVYEKSGATHFEVMRLSEE